MHRNRCSGETGQGDQFLEGQTAAPSDCLNNPISCLASRSVLGIVGRLMVAIAFDAVTVNTGGALQLTNLNSAENTLILIEDGVYTFNGCKRLQADGTEYHGALKVGRSKSFGAELAFDQGDYSFTSITLAANKTNPGPKAKLTVGTLNAATDVYPAPAHLLNTASKAMAHLLKSGQKRMAHL